jgi:hypothetical protein
MTDERIATRIVLYNIIEDAETEDDLETDRMSM